MRWFYEADMRRMSVGIALIWWPDYLWLVKFLAGDESATLLAGELAEYLYLVLISIYTTGVVLLFLRRRVGYRCIFYACLTWLLITLLLKLVQVPDFLPRLYYFEETEPSNLWADLLYYERWTFEVLVFRGVDWQVTARWLYSWYFQPLIVLAMLIQLPTFFKKSRVGVKF